MIKFNKMSGMTAAILAGFLFVAGQTMAAGDAYKTGKTQTDAQHRSQSQGLNQSRFGQSRGLNQSHQVSKLMDQEVQSQRGRKFGNVSDLIVNQQGEIEYLIISSGGLAGMGEDFIPVPWESVQQTGEEGALTINIDENRLKNAPKFSENEFEQPGWDHEVRGYYGEEHQKSREDLRFKGSERKGSQESREYFDKPRETSPESRMDEQGKSRVQ